jgi:hypothetical protein
MGDCLVGFGRVAPHQHWPLQQQRRSGAQQHLFIIVDSQSQAFIPFPSAFGSAHEEGDFQAKMTVAHVKHSRAAHLEGAPLEDRAEGPVRQRV